MATEMAAEKTGRHGHREGGREDWPPWPQGRRPRRLAAMATGKAAEETGRHGHRMAASAAKTVRYGHREGGRKDLAAMATGMAVSVVWQAKPSKTTKTPRRLQTSLRLLRSRPRTTSSQVVAQVVASTISRVDCLKYKSNDFLASRRQPRQYDKSS